VVESWKTLVGMQCYCLLLLFGIMLKIGQLIIREHSLSFSLQTGGQNATNNAKAAVQTVSAAYERTDKQDKLGLTFVLASVNCMITTH